MSYQIELVPTALDELKALPGYIRPQARHLITQLAHHPRPQRARQLRDKPGIYRIWLATHWRIVYEVDDNAQRVLIRRIRRKTDTTYDDL